MEYKKNEDGTYSIISETEEIVRLEDLEAQLANLQQLNDEINRVNEWRLQQPSEFQKYIPEQYLLPVEELQNKINSLKELN